ncbi:IS1182 family transposase [Streptosporangium roseum]|uniref:Transposase IS4 family protein n=1 Tax=Streptosporangium roseum (strain ATCC 12428 / DSM 43021 / JCM 3005 / KCTC 9067 / NCIMB 10171 / NRRL 2505 / NI 9100) TaxID=479432 RepID=D2AQQ6_STRRD|nr:IS1182 family transposase [Streptosporangium roseum]ACZ86453.1 transposase IS4 family protein [Streptosporangium roseum DSM 43021]ACZ86457.1 transposase IS4 family protein [Streptosporangium roseum DSM 43021]ACZ87565.1 transposase IS4 family protein [Streptosporangium roseum DSM 43021]ACZ88511.1 transposase IS4 family protein [Streptosporangium roseum DSM 43021]ACZ91826.1 transposase IS4 family protein [Streptosporangium roseum DSM 43021]
MGGDTGRVIPAETVRAAWAANPSGTPAMWIRDRLAGVFGEKDFVGWFPADGRRGLSPVVLALVSVLQFAENLTDRQAALAVRCRIDWKYCLGLELTDPGFDHSVLSEFRDRMAQDDRADRLLAVMVQRLVEAGLVKQRGRVRTDSTHVLAAVRKLNRVELVGETLRVALEELAAADEPWLAALITPEWASRYGRPVRYDRLPRGKDDLAAHVLQIGQDGMTVLEAVHAAGASRRLRDLPGVQVLRQVWVQQYWTDSYGDLAWRAAKSSRDRQSRHGRPRRSSGEESGQQPDPARVPWSGIEIVSPHDPEARYCRKEGKTTTKAEWVGYRDHQSETCDDNVPNVIVHVLTRPAPVQDIDAVDDIHAGLAASGLTPAEHLLDSGYVTPDVIHHTAQQWGVALIGPVRADPRGRHGFTKEDFHVNWDDHTVTCPRGVTSPPFKPTLGDGKPRLSVLFPRAACRACPDRQACTGDANGKGRHLTLLPEPLQQIQTRNRADQHTEPWKARYALRAGCEATVSETTRAHGLRNCRYKGLAKTHVQHVLTAAGTNVIRLADCYTPGIIPDRPPRPISPFQQLCRRLAAQTPE